MTVDEKGMKKEKEGRSVFTPPDVPYYFSAVVAPVPVIV